MAKRGGVQWRKGVVSKAQGLSQKFDGQEIDHKLEGGLYSYNIMC